MGRALIFQGVSVGTPIRTVTYSPSTADEYVEKFRQVVYVTASVEKALRDFIQRMMDADLWEHFVDFFPMVGGLNTYNKSLKRVAASPAWSLPNTGVTWNSSKNALQLSLPGRAIGVPLSYDGIDPANTTVILSQKTSDYCYIWKDYAYQGGTTESAINELSVSNGGYEWPSWGTSRESRNLSGYSKRAHNVYAILLDQAEKRLYVKSDSNDVAYVSSGSKATVNRVSIAMGGYYNAEVAAPAPSTVSGSVYAFALLDKCLTLAETKMVLNAMYDLDAALGRL